MNYFPKGMLQMTSVAARRWWISDTQLLKIPQCLQRSLASKNHSSHTPVRKRGERYITELSLKNHLHVISACKLLSEGCALIVRCQKWRCFRGREVLKQSSSLLSLCAVVAAVCEADRCCKPTHIAVSLMLVFNIFYTDMINAVSGFPSTVDQMRFDLLSTQWVRLPVGSAVILHKSNIVYSRRDIPENSIIIRI